MLVQVSKGCHRPEFCNKGACQWPVSMVIESEGSSVTESEGSSSWEEDDETFRGAGVPHP
jgi:hypothetical protein